MRPISSGKGGYGDKIRTANRLSGDKTRPHLPWQFLNRDEI